MPSTASSTIRTAPVIDVSSSLPSVPPPVTAFMRRRRRMSAASTRWTGQSVARSCVLMHTVSIWSLNHA